MKKLTLITCIVLIGLLVTRSHSSSFTTYELRRVNVSSEGEQANANALRVFVSPDGNLIVFVSNASNLVSNDDNGEIDLFLHDLSDHTTIRVTDSNDQGIGLDAPRTVSISNDANFIAFRSYSSNLVPNDNNNEGDIFVIDRSNGEIERVSIKSDGTEVNHSSENPSISGDGRFVAFVSSFLSEEDSNFVNDLYLHDRETHQTKMLIGNLNYPVENPVISKDGSTIVFSSATGYIVPNDYNNLSDIFVYDILSETIKRVSVNHVGVQANQGSFDPSISDDSMVVVFESTASNLVTPDINNISDVFLVELNSNKIVRVSDSNNGQQSNAPAYYPRVSGDGRYVTWASRASNLVAGDDNFFCGASFLDNCKDVFVFDRVKEETLIASVSYDGFGANSESNHPEISRDGKTLVFYSNAFNLVENDTNYYSDNFALILPPQLDVYLPVIVSE